MEASCVRLGEGKLVGVELDGSAGSEVVDFARGDPGALRMEFVDINFLVAGSLLDEDQQASADGRGDGRGCLDTEEDMHGRGHALAKRQS